MSRAGISGQALADRDAVAWHDVECGAYAADLALWLELAEAHPGPVLDIGAGTGRVALELARTGRHVTALDLDPVLSAELERRAASLPLDTVVADARSFALPGRFGLIVAPMQTIQLLGGAGARERFLRCARRHLAPGGVLAVAITEILDLYEGDSETSVALPDILEREGIVYCSHPVAVRADAEGFVLERRRERVGADGSLTVSRDWVRLDRVSARGLEQEAVSVGLRPQRHREIPATSDHVGSVVVILGA